MTTSKKLAFALALAISAMAPLGAEELPILTPEVTVETTPGSASVDSYDAEAVVVRGRREGSTASRLNIPAEQVPATLNVVSAESLRQRAASDWTSALRYTSGVMPLKTYGGFHSAVVRGMAENDLVVLLDGVRDDTYNYAFSSPQSNLAGIESIEILKGPNSMLYGTGALAGVINWVTKKPSRNEAYEVELGAGSFGSRKAVVGASGPLAESLSYRLDVGVDEIQGYRHAPSRRANGTLALEWDLAAETRLNLSSTVNRDRYEQPDAGIPVDTATNAVPKNAPLDKNYSSPWDYLDFSAAYSHAELRYGLSGPFSVALRGAFSPADYEYLETEALDLVGSSITRDYLYFTRHHRPWLTQAELSYSGSVGIEQKALLGVDFHHYTTFSERDSALDYSGYAVPSIDLFNPVETAQPVVPKPDGRRNAKQVTQSVYFQDLATLMEGVELLGAVRYDSYERSQSADTLNVNTGDISSLGYVTTTTRSAVTYRLGLMAEPVKDIRLYGSYSTSFKPVLIIDSADGKVDWDPEKGTQLEVGSKFKLTNNGLNGTLAWFDILKSDVMRRVKNAPRQYAQDGTKRSTGFEVELEKSLPAGATLKGSYSYVDARMSRYVIASNEYVQGRPSSAPMHTASLWAHKPLKPWLSAGLGGRFVSENYADDVDNLVALPWYAVADAGVYAKIKGWDLDLVASNVFDQRRYFVSFIQGNYYQLYPGEPLKLDASLRHSF